MRFHVYFIYTIHFSVDLDITGSPLKAGFDPNEVFDNTDDDLRVIARKPKLPDFRCIYYYNFFLFLLHLQHFEVLCFNSIVE